MKIGVLAHPVVSNSVYRAVAPMLALGELGHEIVHVKMDDDKALAADRFLGCDVVHVYRGITQPGLFKALDELRRRGVAITWDDDDDPRLVPTSTPGYKHHYGGAILARTVRWRTAMLTKADLVTTTTQVLADRLRSQFSGPVEVIENYLDASRYARVQRRHEGITIGWVAAQEHAADVEMLELVPMLRDVLAGDERIRITTAGIKLNLDPDRYRFVKMVPFKDLPRWLGELDLAIAPIADHPMSYARSNVKVKEYAAAGVPWVASARGSYAGLGAKAGGVTVADDGWEQALLEVAGSRFKRMRLRRNAESWAKAQHIEHHTARWETVMRMAVDAAAQRRALQPAS